MESKIQQIEELLSIKLEKHDYNNTNQVNTYSTWTQLEGIRELKLENVTIDRIKVLLPFSKNLHTLKLINCTIDNICGLFDFEDLANVTLDNVTITNTDELTTSDTYTKSYQGNLVAVSIKNMDIKHLNVLLPMSKNLTSIYLIDVTINNFYEVNLFPKLNNLTLDNVKINNTEQDICHSIVPNRNFWFLHFKNMSIENIGYFAPISETIIDIDLINCKVGSIHEINKFPSIKCLTIDAPTSINDIDSVNTNTDFKLKECVIAEEETEKVFNLEKLEAIASYIQALTFKNDNISNPTYIKNFISLKALKFDRVTAKLNLFLPIAEQITSIDFSESSIENRSKIQYFKNLEVLKINADTTEQSFVDFKTLLPLKHKLKKLDLWEFLDGGIKNLELIKEFTALESVFVLYTSNEVAKSIFSLSSLKKLSINIRSKKTKVFNLKALKNIKELYLESKNSVILKGLKNLEFLKVVSLKGNYETKGLHKIKKLHYLEINQSTNINELPTIDTLTKLKIDVNEAYEILSLEHFPNLKELSIEGTNKIKLGYLPKLKILDISSTFPKEIDFLEELPKLKKLSLENNILTKVTGLDNLTNLKMLNLSENNIHSIEGVSNLQRLEHLNLYENKISDIQILNTLPNLKKVNIAGNKIEKPEIRLQLNKPEIATFYGLPTVPFWIWKDQDFKL